jgi:murein DD-endopeptidase MepM/ murein hydrolase activator NlpD
MPPGLMTSEQPPRDALRPYRPLPSINIPLLREERSALRSRRLVRVAILATLCVAAAASLAFGIHFLTRPAARIADQPLSPDELDVPPAVPEAAASPSVQPAVVDDEPGLPPGFTRAPDGTPRPVDALPLPGAGSSAGRDQGAPGSQVASKSQHTFGKALSFKDALVAGGLSKDETNALIAALDAPMDFRRSQPEDQFTVERDAAGKLLRFEYRSGLTLRYEAVKDGDKLRARQIPVPVKIKRISKGGVVSGSLGDALEGLALGRTLAGVFTEVFEGKIDFSTDTRSGDTFRIILDEESVDGVFLRWGVVHALEYSGEKAGTRRAYWHAGKDDDGDFYDESGRALHGGWLRTPLRYDHISSGFGMRMHPVLRRKQLHNGIDYAAGSGTPVRAGAAGIIGFAGPKGANGNLLVIQHAQGFETCYAHLLRFAPGIKKGVKVKQRQVVAYVGTTGRSTGPHLHFSLKKHGRFIDPESQLNGPGLPMPSGELPEFKRQVRELSTALGRVPIDQPAPVASPALHTAGELGEEEL